MLTLAEAAKLRPDQFERGVLETFALANPLMLALPFQPVAGAAYKYATEATLPGVEFRAVNSSYVESTGTFNQKTEALVILGGDSDVDTFIVQTTDNNPAAIAQTRALTLAGKIKAITYKFQDAFFNGDVAVDANSFDGLKKRLVGAQVIDAGGAANGIPVQGTDTVSANNALDAIDGLLARVPGANALFLNGAILAKVQGTLRRLGFAETTQIGGLGPLVTTYRGVPLLDAGQRPDGTDIIPVNETQGTSSDSSSIYAVHFGRTIQDGGVTGLQNGAPQVKDLGELDVKPAFRHRVEWFPGLAVFGPRAAARLRGVRNA